MVKRILKEITPPIVVDFFKAFLRRNTKKVADSFIVKWSGNYSSWEEAKSHSVGYDSDIIFKKTAESILKVKNGEAVYERDSVLFDKPVYSWPLLAILLKVAVEKGGSLNILDFGGSLGSSYYQNKTFLSCLDRILWSVVEQEHYIQFGNDNVADDSLKFYFNIEDCIKERHPSVLLLSGVIQCIDNPYKWLQLFIDKEFEYIVFDRTAFIDDDKDRLTVQTVPQGIYDASYPAWFFNKANIVKLMSTKFDFIIDFNNGFTNDIKLDGRRAYWNGLFFKRRKQ